MVKEDLRIKVAISMFLYVRKEYLHESVTFFPNFKFVTLCPISLLHLKKNIQIIYSNKHFIHLNYVSS